MSARCCTTQGARINEAEALLTFAPGWAAQLTEPARVVKGLSKFAVAG